jgi:hypothetical protein
LTQTTRIAVGATIYVAAAAIWIFVFLDPGRGVRSHLAFFVVSALSGYVARSWLALLYPIAPFVLSVPAGTSDGGEFPLVFSMAAGFPLLLAAVAIGVAAARAVERRRAGPAG